MNDKITLFEVHIQDGAVYRIWPDGRVEGFTSPCVVINHYPALVHQETQKEQ